jgi:hypothetical protein
MLLLRSNMLYLSRKLLLRNMLCVRAYFSKAALTHNKTNSRQNNSSGYPVEIT